MRRDTPSRPDVLAELTSLRRYARSLARNDHDAEDLVHDTLLRAYEKRGSYDGRRKLRTWLFSILHNVFVDRRRSEASSRRRHERSAAGAPLHLAPGQEHHVRLAQVRAAFMQLPEDQRAALHLVAIEGMSYGEAAAALDVPVGTLMSRLSRARAALRAIEDGPQAAPARPAAASPHLRLIGGSDEPSA